MTKTKIFLYFILALSALTQYGNAQTVLDVLDPITRRAAKNKKEHYLSINGRILFARACKVTNSSRLEVLFFKKLKNREYQNEPSTRFTVTNRKFFGARPLPRGSYRIELIKIDTRQTLTQTKVQATGSQLDLDLLVTCNSK